MPEGSQKRKATRVRSLRQRWIVNSVVPIFVLLALIVGGVSLGISNYYYKGMLDGLERQARAQSGAFVDYFMDQGFANYLQRANQAISDYADKERVEMQFLSSVGRIQASSTSNLTVGTRPGTEDISRAVETNRISYFWGADPKTGEQILAVSHPLTVNGKVVGVLRFVTSLRQVNVQVRMTVLAVVLVALLCLLLAACLLPLTARTAHADQIYDEIVNYQVDVTPNTEDGSLILESLRRRLGAADKTIPAIQLDNDLSATMLRYLRLQEQKQQVETQAKTLDTEMQRLKGQMVAKLDGSCMAMGEYGGTQYTISYNPVSRTGITKDNLQKLKLLHPDIYDEYVTVSESRRFSIKAKSADEAA